jgi:hypothetical protein
MDQDSAALGEPAWLGGAGEKAAPSAKDLPAALPHFAKKTGRPCTLVARRARDGLTAPTGGELISWATVPAGGLYLARRGGEIAYENGNSRTQSGGQP